MGPSHTPSPTPSSVCASSSLPYLFSATSSPLSAQLAHLLPSQAPLPIPSPNRSSSEPSTRNNPDPSVAAVRQDAAEREDKKAFSCGIAIALCLAYRLYPGVLRRRVAGTQRLRARHS